MRDVGGVRAWRARPLRERLLPWPVYAVAGLVALGCGLYLVSGRSESAGAGPVGVLFLLMVLPALYLALLSRRQRR